MPLPHPSLGGPPGGGAEHPGRPGRVGARVPGGGHRGLLVGDMGRRGLRRGRSALVRRRSGRPPNGPAAERVPGSASGPGAAPGRHSASSAVGEPPNGAAPGPGYDPGPMPLGCAGPRACLPYPWWERASCSTRCGAPPIATTSPLSPTRTSRRPSAIPAAPLLRVVAVGDSSLTAPGIEDLDDVWLRRLVRRYAEGHRVELISLGVGGSRARDVVDGQLDAAAGPAARHRRRHRRLQRRHPGHAASAATAPTWSTIVARLEEVSGAVLVLGMGDLGSIPRLPPSLRPYLSRRSRRFDAACVRVAVSHPHAVKVHTRGRMVSAFYDDPPSSPATSSTLRRGPRRLRRGGGAAFDAAYRIAQRRASVRLASPAAVIRMSPETDPTCRRAGAPPPSPPTGKSVRTSPDRLCSEIE